MSNTAKNNRLDLIRSIIERRNKEKDVPFVEPSSYDLEEERYLAKRKAGEILETVDSEHLGLALAMSSIWGD